jgi:glucan phosphorylase
LLAVRRPAASPFSSGPAETWEPILNSLSNGNDYYLLAHDFPSYLEAQERVDETYKNQQLWTRMSIMSTCASHLPLMWLSLFLCHW